MKQLRGLFIGLGLSFALAAVAVPTIYNYFPPPGITYGPTTGTVFGTATGGAQGSGTINAQGLFINGAAVVTGGVPVGANPTGTVGLTAVNGSATTFLRSDGAPALSQAISPTWTGQHLFTGGTNSQIAVGGVSAGIDAGGGSVLWTNGSAATDAHLWECSANPAAFTCRTLNDAFSASRNYMQVQRSALAITHMLFGNTTDNNDFTFQGTGAVNINNELVQGDGTASYVRNASGTGGLFLGIGATNYWQLNHNGGLVNTTVPAAGTALTVNQNAASATTLLVANAADNTSDIIFSGLTKGIRFGHSPTGSTIEGVDQTGVGSFQPLGVNGSTLSFGTGSSISGRMTISATGAVVVNAPASSGIGFTVNGFANSYTALVQSSATSGQALGLNIQAGTTSADKALHISNAGNTLGLFDVFGDGGLVVGVATGGDQGAGTINMQGCFVNGVACSTGGAAGANPTGTVGLTAVNGVAGTFLRSDAAPPLSQAITPTWTGVHTFANTGTSIVINNSGGGTDAKNTRINYNGSGNFSVSSATDAAPTTAVTSLLGTTRTGTAWTGLSFGSTTDNPTYSFLGTGQLSVSGGVVVGGATGGNQGAGTINMTGCFVNGVACLTSSVSAGNPTGTVGLTAVNGSASTYMRSDAAPPLSQAITPTWTGTHTFNNTTANVVLNNSGGALNAKNTLLRESTAGFLVQSATDAAPTTAVTSIFTASRTGSAWTGINFGNTTDNPTYSFLGTGQVTTSGNVTVNAPPSGVALTATGCASCNTVFFQANTGAGTSFGPIVQAGTNSSDINSRFLNASGGANYLEIFGDGGVIVGNPTGGDKGLGTINAQAIYVNGAPVSAGASKFVAGVMTIGASSCTVNQNTAGISSCTFNSTGNVTVVFSSAFAAGNCVANATNSTYATALQQGSPVTSGINVTTQSSSGVFVNTSFSLICFGN